MHRVFPGSVLALMFGILALSQSHPTVAASSDPAATTFIAQDPNQDNLQMTCKGSVAANGIDYTVFFTREAGFSRIEFRRPSNSQLIAEAFLSYDKNNDKGQAIWRGSVNDAAKITLVHLANRPARLGDQI